MRLKPQICDPIDQNPGMRAGLQSDYGIKNLRGSSFWLHPMIIDSQEIKCRSCEQCYSHSVLRALLVHSCLFLASSQSLSADHHRPSTRWPLRSLNLPSRPPHLHRRRSLRGRQNNVRRILGSKSGSGVDFAGRSEPRTHHQANHCSDAVRITGRPFQEHSNSRFASPIAVDTGLSGMLSHGQVRAPVGIDIGHRTAALLTRQTESGLARAKTPNRPRPSPKSTSPVPAS